MYGVHNSSARIARRPYGRSTPMTHVLISGASVAGPALAYWLRRHGMDVTVVERSPAPRPGGQGIDIRGAARTVIERMGLMDQVPAMHTGVHGIAYVGEHN